MTDEEIIAAVKAIDLPHGLVVSAAKFEGDQFCFSIKLAESSSGRKHLVNWHQIAAFVARHPEFSSFVRNIASEISPDAYGRQFIDGRWVAPKRGCGTCPGA